MQTEDRGHRYWWRAEKPDVDRVHETVIPYAQYLRQQSLSMNWRDRVYESIYEDERFARSDAYADARERLRASGFTASTLNVTRSILDTIVARVGKRHPAIKVNATDVNYALKRKSRRLGRFLVAEQQDMNVAMM